MTAVRQGLEPGYPRVSRELDRVLTVVHEQGWERQLAAAVLSDMILPATVLQEAIGKSAGDEILAVPVKNSLLLGGRHANLSSHGRLALQGLILCHDLGSVTAKQLRGLDPSISLVKFDHTLHQVGEELNRLTGRQIVSCDRSGYTISGIRFEDPSWSAPPQIPPGLPQFVKSLISGQVIELIGIGEERNNQASDLESAPEPDDSDWGHRAVCRGEDPELFFPDGNSGSAKLQTAEAKAVCRRCPVSSECLTFALDNDERFGVWGGMSVDERRRLKRRKARTRTQIA